MWPDKNLGIFGPKDTRLPLPGNIGIASTIQHDKKVRFGQASMMGQG